MNDDMRGGVCPGIERIEQKIAKETKQKGRGSVICRDPAVVRDTPTNSAAVPYEIDRTEGNQGNEEEIHG